MNTLPPPIQRFVLHWGEMGTKWGINRTVAQIHALLFIAERPLHAEDICEQLGVARSNVSNSLRELQNWGIVSVVHLPNDRRDHFESVKEVFELFRIIAAERKRREIDPTLKALRHCAEEAADTPDSEHAYASQKMGELLEFFESLSRLHLQLDQLPSSSLQSAMKMSDKIVKTLGLISK